MARFEIDGILKHAPLTEAQISSTNRNLDREIVIHSDFDTQDPFGTGLGSNDLVNYILSYEYDNGSVTIRRNVATLELLANSTNTGTTNDKAGADWVNTEDKSYNSISSGGVSVQTALEELDTAISDSSQINYILDGSTAGSVYSSPDGTAGTDVTGTATYQINFGNANTIADAASSSNLGGTGNEITNVLQSGIIAGDSNTIYSDTLNYIANSFIGAGTTNKIEYWATRDLASETGEFIGAGILNIITLTSNQARGLNSIISGITNYIYESDYSSIVNGASNYIKMSTSSSIGSGQLNKMSKGLYSAISAGGQNTIGFSSDITSISRVSNVITVTLADNVPDLTEATDAITISGTVNFDGAYTIATIGAHPTATFTINDTGADIAESTGIVAVGVSNNCGIFVGATNTVYGASVSQSAIVAGSANVIQEGDLGAIVAGSGNTVRTSGGCVIAGGINNYISNLGYSFIGAGNGNYIIDGATYSFIGAGIDNYIQNGSTHSAIAAGENNSINTNLVGVGTGSTHNFIGAGTNNYIDDNTDYSAVLTGSYNYIDITVTNSVVGAGNYNAITNIVNNSSISAGSYNRITVCENSSIGAGNNNYIDDSDNSMIGAGISNLILDTSKSFIAAGTNNVIESDSSFIGAGLNNDIGVSSSYTFIGAGATNTIGDGSDYSAIVGGSENSISDTSLYSFIGTGRDNLVAANSDYASILAGQSNLIHGTGDWNTIVTGFNNEIYFSNYTSIGGGRDNYIDVADYATIPGGYGAKAINYGELAHASGYFATRGDSQHSTFVLRASTNNDTVYLTPDGVNAVDNSLIMPTGAGWNMSVKLVGVGGSGADVTILNYIYVANNSAGTTSVTQVSGQYSLIGNSLVIASNLLTFGGDASGRIWATIQSDVAVDANWTAVVDVSQAI